MQQGAIQTEPRESIRSLFPSLSWADAKSGPPWKLILGGVAALAVTGAIVYFVRRPEQEEDSWES